MTTIRARAPLRLGLAGGGTDISPYCDMYGGNLLNVTIDRYAYATITLLDKSYVCFSATDQGIESIRDISEPLELNGVLNLHVAVFNYIMENYNNSKNLPLSLITYCEAPAGSGLGSSSAIVVVMVRAFVELLNLPLDDYRIAQAAYKIERDICALQGGRQDQYSATFGGFNFMEFYAEGRAVINPLRVKNWIICELEASLVLFFTGTSRESAHIISDQSNNVKLGVINAIDAMHGIKREAVVMKECLLRGDFNGVAQSMHLGWESKKLTATTVSNPFIDEIYDSAIKAGALAGKVSGAGGGGFMLFFVHAEKRAKVIEALNHFNGQVSSCHFTKAGAQAWRL
jgi:D-glycero-alpha-D-manno-heptose-7-phosphate kinase